LLGISAVAEVFDTHVADIVSNQTKL
jgi:hypothetical protein